MNIRFIIGNTLDESTQVADVIEKVLPLCGQGKPEGQAEGLMPLKLHSGVVVTPRVTVYTSTSTNRRGAVSAVMKVSIPYTALKLSDDGSAVAGTDAARSGGELAMHTVLTLPAAAVADLTGANGTTMTANAEKQVAVVARLLTALLAQRLIDPGYAQVDSNGTSAITTRFLVNDEVGGEGGLVAVQNSTLVPTDGIAGFVGNVGFDVTSYSVPRDLSEVLSRVAAKQAPLGCSDVKVRSFGSFAE